MKNILITESEGNIGNKIILELFKKGHKITLVTKSSQVSYESLPIPIKFIQLNLENNLLGPKDIEDIDIVLNLSCLETSVSSKKLSLAKNLVKSFLHDVHFYHFSSSDIYKQSFSIVSENSPLGSDSESSLWAKVETVFESHRSTVIRPGFIIGSENRDLKSAIYMSRFFLGTLKKSDELFSWIHINDLILNLENTFLSSEHRKFINLFAQNSTSVELVESITSLTNRKSILFRPFLKKLLFVNSKNCMTSIHADSLKFKFTDLSLALENSFCKFKSPNLQNSMFHYEYTRVQYVKKDINTVFDFFKNAQNLGKITPKKLRFTILSQSTKEIQQGTVFTYRLQLNGIPFSWTTHIDNWDAPNIFTDYQAKGPYQVWYHTHEFFDIDGGTLMLDNIKYRLPFGFLGDLFGLVFVRYNMRAIFGYRFKTIKDLLK